MREFIGLILFVILITIWSKVFAHPEDKSVVFPLNSEIVVNNAIQD